MGEAKRRAAWIAKGGEDWGLVKYRTPARYLEFGTDQRAITLKLEREIYEAQRRRMTP